MGMQMHFLNSEEILNFSGLHVSPEGLSISTVFIKLFSNSTTLGCCTWPTLGQVQGVSKRTLLNLNNSGTEIDRRIKPGVCLFWKA